MGRDGLGEFEHLVLLSILRLSGDAYSVSVVLDLEAVTGREISQAAVFMTLRRLEVKGFLASRLDDASVPDTGRERRYFSITAAGVQRLRAARTMMLRLWDGIANVLDEA